MYLEVDVGVSFIVARTAANNKSGKKIYKLMSMVVS